MQQARLKRWMVWWGAAAAIALLMLAAARAQPAAAAGPRGTPTATSSATRSAALTPAPTPIPATAAGGLATYKRLGCIGCHKLADAGSKGGYGPAHDQMATVAAQRIAAADYAGEAASAAEYIAESILHPNAYIVPEYRLVKYRMPHYPKITDAEVAALTALLLEQE